MVASRISSRAKIIFGFFVAIAVSFAAGFLVASKSSAQQSPVIPSPQHQNFCGYSTYAPCSADSDCIKGGCSGQICQGRKEQSAITTCEWRECYDASKYGLSCKCISGKCMWA